MRAEIKIENLLPGKGDERGWLDFLARLAWIYRESMGRPLPITSELGELYACVLLGLRRTPPGTRGYDALDGEGKKVQIKTRAPETGGEVNRMGTLGKFTSWNFDYALLVLLKEEWDKKRYGVEEIWKAGCAELKNAQAKKKKRGIPVHKFLKLGEMIFPEPAEG